MEHLNAEALARLVDEHPTPEETVHLGSCEACTTGLEAMRSQTAALGSLPEILPPKGDWRVLEAQLRSEGLMNDAGLFQRLGLAQTPVWMKAAAAVMLFLSGTGTGVAMASTAQATSIPTEAFIEFASVEDAASQVRAAEQDYVSAVAAYRELLDTDGRGGMGTDPVGRFAALEHLVMVSQAAVRQAPGDAFFNGFLASAMAERDAAARMVSSNRDRWF
jgi:hypothetical protein